MQKYRFGYVNGNGNIGFLGNVSVIFIKETKTETKKTVQGESSLRRILKTWSHWVQVLLMGLPSL